MKDLLPKIREGFFDLLYPEGITCYLCGQKIRTSHRYGICESCHGEFEFIDENSCKKCGKYTLAPGLCRDCQSFTHSFQRGYSLCVYDGKVREWVYSFKYAGRSYLARPFGRMMAERIKQIGLLRRIDGILSVPIHRKKLRQRGYNQSHLLAQVIKNELSIKKAPYVLRRDRDTPPLSGLTRSQRRQTMEGAFGMVESRRKTNIKNVLLIDDIYTTGSTVNQCANILKDKGGVEKVYVFALASGRDV